MFTPPKKIFSGWSPRTDPTRKSGSGGGDVSKGKDVVFDEDGLMGRVENTGENMGLKAKLMKLETELFDYQYNMGLLLIEKKEWTSKYEELQRVYTETKDALKQEQAAHLNAISDVEKREENLTKALGVEKQCVFDLEKALRDMRSEYAEIKFTSDSKLAEANALITSVEEKSLEVELKLHSADAKLAELSRKSSDIERKSHELEARESALRRERLSLNAERESLTDNISRQREDLREWERKLQEDEERLAEVRRLLNQREERANENDRLYQQKQSELESEQKKIEIIVASLKNKEDDISSRIEKLNIREKESDAMKHSLEIKERDLIELEEKLKDREQVEIQKLLDEHKAILEVKKHSFELEMEKRKNDFENDLQSRAVEVEKKEVEVKHMEVKLAKREQALDQKHEKLKEKELHLESKLQDLKEREKSMRLEEDKIEGERNQLLSDKQELLSLKTEIEKERASTEEQCLKLSEEIEQLKITEEERSEHVRLQSELKQEIENWRHQRELLLKEEDELKQEKLRFEKEWEDLDEKRTEVMKELEDITVQKENFKKLKHSEEDRLNNKKLDTESYVQKELDALKLAKDSFAATMEHEKSVIAERTTSEKNQMLNDFELWKRELETKLFNEKEDLENALSLRVKQFDEEREKELNNINYKKEIVSKEMEDMKLERSTIAKEKQEIIMHQKHLDEQHLVMRKDIGQLVGLSEKLKDQREQFFKERERFIRFVESHKSCKSCGEMTSEFVLSDLQSLADLENMKALSVPQLAENYLRKDLQGTPDKNVSNANPGAVAGSPASGGPRSWLQKCTSKIFVFSASKKNEVAFPDQNISRRLHVEASPKKLLNTEVTSEMPFEVAADALDMQNMQSNNSNREVGSGIDLSGGEQSIIDSKALEVEDSHQSDVRAGNRKPGKRAKGRVSRKHSMKEVTEEAKTVLADSIELNENEHSNGLASAYTNESRGDSSLVGKRTRNSRAGDVGADYSEGHSDSATAGGRQKRRRKVVPAVQAPTGRYNLRRHKTAAPLVANGASSDPNKGKEKEIDDGGSMREEIPDEVDGSTHLIQVKTLKRIDMVNEYSSAGLHRSNAACESQDGDTENQIVSDMLLSEEVNGTPEQSREYQNQGDRTGADGEDEDGDDDEVEHPGEVSMGKKVWKFLTT
ncbi:Protein CROWDED NUCLEI like [Heracleum sosnowskyi]|uniref:Protein CROWDED NUCLEI like n=1 Tax=Heracleum sosnowskyi TaxID=360622 RepID=A0AAD8MSN1_9APIA|nr:Protein CROWDED NUCLEI like [Heracleum sosnowskyi]